MRMIYKILIFIFSLSLPGFVAGQVIPPDTVSHRQEVFYDSLEYRASKKKLTKIIYDFLINPPRPLVDEKALSLKYYRQMEGKLIAQIDIKMLDAFGPTLQDTARKARGWLEKFSNGIHTKSNLKSIKRLLMFKEGDFIDPELLYENERIIRSLPYIKDVRFLLNQDSTYTGLTHLTVLIKDRFSFGATGGVEGSESAALQVFNQNIFGIGHEISFRFVGNIQRQPYVGLEAFYKIKNIKGKFLDLSVGYLNTYKREGLPPGPIASEQPIHFSKPFS